MNEIFGWLMAKFRVKMEKRFPVAEMMLEIGAKRDELSIGIVKREGFEGKIEGGFKIRLLVMN